LPRIYLKDKAYINQPLVLFLLQFCFGKKNFKLPT
jgi:hypothetical protein